MSSRQTLGMRSWPTHMRAVLMARCQPTASNQTHSQPPAPKPAKASQSQPKPAKASQSQSPTIDTTGGIVLIQILQILDLVVVVL